MVIIMIIHRSGFESEMKVNLKLKLKLELRGSGLIEGEVGSF